MKKTFVASLLYTVVLVSILSFSKNECAAHERGLALKKGEYLIEQSEEDVNGDYIKDKIFLIAQRDEGDGAFNRRVFVKIIDGKTDTEIELFDDLAGYGGKLFLGDFTGDQVADVMVSVDSGGSGGIVYTRIASLKNNKVEFIFNEQDNQGVKIKSKFIDGFKAELKLEQVNKTIVIDLSAFKDLYVENKIYDRKGELQEEVEPWIDPFSLLEPVDMDGDGVYELRGFQAVAGFFHANRISELESLWKYEKKWRILTVKYSTTLAF